MQGSPAYYCFSAVEMDKQVINYSNLPSTVIGLNFFVRAIHFESEAKNSCTLFFMEFMYLFFSNIYVHGWASEIVPFLVIRE